MNLALTWCAKEWRSQRNLLAAYMGLSCASLGALFALAPEHSWRSIHRTSEVLGWFMAVGVLGVLVFAAPQVARGELGSKGDQFVQRLPGALGPAFAGKMLFLLLVTALLPLLGLLAGELCLTAIGRDWSDLFAGGDGVSEIDWPWNLPVALAALLLAPWVSALAWWMPGGRMALGAVIVVGCGLALATTAVLRSCPFVESSLNQGLWLGYVAPAGLVVAAVSFVCGRRGGGARRSAKLGGIVFLVSLAPPAASLGAIAYEYHHPDLQHPALVAVDGLSPDAGTVLAKVAEHEAWMPVLARIDLVTGAATQVGGIFTYVSDGQGWGRNGVPRRFWALAADDTVRWIDLATGALLPGDNDEYAHYPPPAQFAAAVRAEARASAPFCAPGNLRAWVVDKKLVVERVPDGAVDSFAWPVESLACPAGHGICCAGARERLFDLTRRQWVTVPKDATWSFAVSGLWLLGDGPRRRIFDPEDGAVRECAEIQGCGVVSLFDDERVLLMRRGPRESTGELLVYHLRAGTLEPLAWPAEFATGGRVDVSLASTRRVAGGSRDARGRLWLKVVRSGRPGGFLTIEPDTGRCEAQLVGASPANDLHVLAIEPSSMLLQEDSHRIVRIDLATAQRTVLYPRQ